MDPVILMVYAAIAMAIFAWGFNEGVKWARRKSRGE